MNKKLVSVVIGLMCMLFTIGITIQFKTVKSYTTVATQTSAQSELKNQILKTKEKYDNLYKTVEAAEKELEIERTNSTNNNGKLSSLEEEIKYNKKLLGQTDVTGSGIKIILQDSTVPISTYIGDQSDLVIHDGDIIRVVNYLFNAGAEAVSVNEQRIVSRTAIDCEGSVIKINGEKVGAPFEIKAIGYPEYLASVDMVGGVLEQLRARNLQVTLTKETELTIPKYSGTLIFNYVK